MKRGKNDRTDTHVVALSIASEGETFLFVDWSETIMIKLPVQINVAG